MVDEPSAPDAGEQAMERIREKIRVKNPEEIKRPAKFIKTRDLEEIIQDLIRRYGGLANAELLEKIAGLEMRAAEERAQCEERWRDRVAEAEKRAAVESGRAADLEAKLEGARSEIERLSAELAALQRAFSSEEARTRAELEKRVVELQARIVELEIGLDFFDLEEEPDAGRARAALDEVGRRLEGLGPAAAVREGAARLANHARTAREKYELLKEKMFEGKGTVGVVVDMVKALKEEEAVEQQARRIAEVLDARGSG